MLDFDIACAVRLELYDKMRMENQAILTANAVGKVFGGSSDDPEAIDQAEWERKYGNPDALVW